MTEETGIPLVDSVAVWGASTVAILGAAGALWRPTRRIVRRLGEFLDDWDGAPGRPGVPARPGVMERLGGIDKRLTAVEHELHPNSGGSLRDALDRVDRRTKRAIPAEEDA